MTPFLIFWLLLCFRIFILREKRHDYVLQFGCPFTTCSYILLCLLAPSPLSFGELLVGVSHRNNLLFIEQSFSRYAHTSPECHFNVKQGLRTATQYQGGCNAMKMCHSNLLLQETELTSGLRCCLFGQHASTLARGSFQLANEHGQRPNTGLFLQNTRTTITGSFA